MFAAEKPRRTMCGGATLLRNAFWVLFHMNRSTKLGAQGEKGLSVALKSKKGRIVE